MAQKKNPLYIVSEKSGIVEEAFSKLDFIVKKLGLTSFVNYLKETINQLLSMVNNYQMFVIVKGYIDEFLSNIINLFGKFAKS
ncbi:hypothetical protein N9B72_02005 [Bacteriovoracaceae bacterium]|nr:hypothetical protein [Bacteriovoracaceae bacterium]